MRISLLTSAATRSIVAAMFPNVGALDVQPLTQLCKALGDDTRLRIMALLSHGELCTCHIEAALDLSQPNASRHMGILRSAGLVHARRAGNWIYYRIASQVDLGRRKVLDTLVKQFGAEEQLKKDVVRLLKAKGPDSCK
jgi:ArsR family transcriptional regulator, arsenate/arsenite/antimonite-responsive transcriptional repressor